MRLSTTLLIMATALAIASQVQCVPILLRDTSQLVSQATRLPDIDIAKSHASSRYPVEPFDAAAREADRSQGHELKARSGADSIRNVAEAAGKSIDQIADDLSNTAPTWRNFHDPKFKPEVQRTAAFNRALELMELRTSKRHPNGRVDLVGLSPAEQAEYQNAKRLVNYHLQSNAVNKERRAKRASKELPMKLQLRELGQAHNAPSWLHELDPEIRAKIKMRIDGRVHLEDLSEKERRVYASKYEAARTKRLKAAKRAAKSSPSTVSSASNVNHSFESDSSTSQSITNEAWSASSSSAAHDRDVLASPPQAHAASPPRTAPPSLRSPQPEPSEPVTQVSQDDTPWPPRSPLLRWPSFGAPIHSPDHYGFY